VSIVRHAYIVLAFALILASEASRAYDALDHCAICGGDFASTVYTVTDKLTGEKLQVCYTCAMWPDVCFQCGLPARAGSIALSDTRILCARDAKTAVLDDDDAVQICNDVRDALDRQFSRFTSFPTNVDVEVVDRVNLVAMFKEPGNDLECPNILGYFQPRTNDNVARNNLSVLSALRRSQLKAVCAHELGHCWVHDNVSASRRKALGNSAEEGFCELLAYLLMSAQHETFEQKQILENHYTRGQIELFIAAEKRFGFNDILDWMKSGVDPLLRADDLSRIRYLAAANPVPQRTNEPVAQTIEVAPPPDTLMLTSISWINNQPFAVINDRTFAVGESGKVRISTSNLTIRCVSIATNSARVQIIPGDAEQELPLKNRKRK